MARRSEADDLAMMLALNYRTMAIVIGEGLLPFWDLKETGLVPRQPQLGKSHLKK